MGQMRAFSAQSVSDRFAEIAAYRDDRSNVCFVVGQKHRYAIVQ